MRRGRAQASAPRIPCAGPAARQHHVCQVQAGYEQHDGGHRHQHGEQAADLAIILGDFVETETRGSRCARSATGSVLGWKLAFELSRQQARARNPAAASVTPGFSGRTTIRAWLRRWRIDRRPSSRMKSFGRDRPHRSANQTSARPGRTFR